MLPVRHNLFAAQRPQQSQLQVGTALTCFAVDYLAVFASAGVPVLCAHT